MAAFCRCFEMVGFGDWYNEFEDKTLTKMKGDDIIYEKFIDRIVYHCFGLSRIKERKMKKIRLMLDFLSGPIWNEYFDPEAHRETTGIEIIDNDEILQAMNEEIQDLYSSYYEFNSHGVACWFNEEQEKADKEKMLGLLKRLNDRLAELNDGSFVVEDLETERVMNL